ncbi:hypothetical protein B0T16DRAFT_459014 [Cercophora newfieldiana]|uniref:Uncharacterized protein n=1 Tax=Cercophora newfieldiana TaxID=92897 RepID=A0AA39Y844_9PEZI|nr:hypothetical protein B0T16DRAFT_459014 [Cercophora newfieldiana]
MTTSCDYLTLISRVGPLTTTFTPPADCTGNPQLDLLHKTSVSPAPPYDLDPVGVLHASETCEPSKIETKRGFPVETYYFLLAGCVSARVHHRQNPGLRLPRRDPPSEALVLCCRNGYWVDRKSNFF